MWCMYTTSNLLKNIDGDLRFETEPEIELESAILIEIKHKHHDYAVRAQAYIVNLSC